MTPKELALTNVPEAKRWATAAVGALNAIIGFSGTRSNIATLSQFKAAATHFHVSLGPPPGVVTRLLRLLPFTSPDPTLAILTEVRFRYFDIISMLSNSAAFVDAPAGGGAEQVGTAPAFVPQTRDGTLRITPYYQQLGPLTRAHCLVHEATHFLSDAFQDHAYRDRTGESDQNKYKTLPVQFAIRNADSYAYFAMQMAKGLDRVITGDE
jgi:hypothetical protein